MILIKSAKKMRKEYIPVYFYLLFLLLFILKIIKETPNRFSYMLFCLLFFILSIIGNLYRLQLATIKDLYQRLISSSVRLRTLTAYTIQGNTEICPTPACQFYTSCALQFCLHVLDTKLQKMICWRHQTRNT